MIRPKAFLTGYGGIGGVATLAVLIAVYLIGAFTLGVFRWDGLSPEPYRFVSPPPGVQNPGPPASASQQITFSNGVSNQAQVYTSDLQAQLILGDGTFPPDATNGPVTVTITPQAPPQLANLQFHGNAYVVHATYTSGAAVPAPWKKPALVYLRFPSGSSPNGLYLLSGGQATRVSPTVDFPSSTVQGNSDQGGVYVAAGPPVAAKPPSNNPALLAVLFTAPGILIIAVGVVLALRYRAANRHQ